MKKYLCAVSTSLVLSLASVSVHAEILKGQRIVGYYGCGTMQCNFVTPDAGTFDFEVADKKVASKIFKKCKIDDICAITGDFDIQNATIIKVNKVENSGTQHKE